MTGPDGWRHDAACRGVDPNVFYRREGTAADPGETDERWAQRAKVAKRICYGCPVRQECLNEAVANREPEGVWGGLDFPAEWGRAQRQAARGRAERAARAAPYLPPVRDAASDRC